jgi:XTP/dITP diphosphohydrolase
MDRILFATNNKNKLVEVKNMLDGSFNIVGMGEVGFTEDIPETKDTLEGNAEQKAEFLHKKLQCNVIADDTGLEIESLNGEPGVLSARYAGIDKDSNANMDKVLDKLGNNANRKAQFRTVICLIYNNEKYFFEGVVKGEIIKEKTGNDGFGYDPIFLPDGFEQTFAEMPMDAKNGISHRGRAIEKLVSFLKPEHKSLNA